MLRHDEISDNKISKIATLLAVYGTTGTGGGGSVDPSDIAYELEAIIDMIEAGLIELELVGADEDGVVFGEDNLVYIY